MGVIYGGFYVVVALFAAPLAGLFIAMPPAVLAIITGLALIAALTGAPAQPPARSDASLLRVPRCDRLAALGWTPRGWERLHADLPAIIEECP